MKKVSSGQTLVAGFSPPRKFSSPDWATIPEEPGVYLIYDREEMLYVGMAGHSGKGSLRRRLKDHSSGNIVNMFAQYLFLARVQFSAPHCITHPRAAQAACQAYIVDRCSFRFRTLKRPSDARELEAILKNQLRPALNAP